MKTLAEHLTESQLQRFVKYPKYIYLLSYRPKSLDLVQIVQVSEIIGLGRLEGLQLVWDMCNEQDFESDIEQLKN